MAHRLTGARSTARARVMQARYRALVAEDHIEVHYQPIIAVRRGEVIAIEALARLRDGDRLIQPGEFLPQLAAEDREILFQAVLRRGAACLRRLAPIAPRLGLSINVDAEVLSRGAVPAMIETVLTARSIAPCRLIVELLESHEFPDLEMARDRLELLRRVGVTVAIDDLGIEFSTLKRVQRLPVDYLKIDKVFLADVMQNPNDLVFLASFVTMARELGMKLCVEGVETLDMLDALRIMGAPMAQGFGIARPMPEEALSSWLINGAGRPIKGPPRTMLGAYALHTRWLRVFLFAPNEASLVHYLRRDSQLSLDGFLRRTGLDQAPLGAAYAELMALTDHETLDTAAVHVASERVRVLLTEAVIAHGLSKARVPARTKTACQSGQGFADGPIQQGHPIKRRTIGRDNEGAAVPVALES